LQPLRLPERIDTAKRYHLALDPAFPGAIEMSWHERLERFCPLSGPGMFRMGARIEPFDASGILPDDNLRLHGAGGFEGPRPPNPQAARSG
jgi:hypothetical protein